MSLKKWIPFLTAFVLPLLIIYTWWGGFNPVTIEPGQMRGPYTYAYLEHTGDYSKLTDLQGKVGAALAAEHIPAGKAITVLFSDPEKVNVGDRVGRSGYLVPEGTQVKAPLKVDTIQARPVLLVQVQTAILLAPSRAYQALHDYLKGRGQSLHMPTVEIYEASSSLLRNGILNVEMPEAEGAGR